MDAEVTLLLALKINWSEYEKLKKGEEISTYYRFNEYGKVKVSVLVRKEDFSKKENLKTKGAEEKGTEENKKIEVCDTTFFENERELLIRVPLSELEDPITMRISGDIEKGIPAKSFQIDIIDSEED